MTNKELQDLLKQYPDDAEIAVCCFDYFGDTAYKELSELILHLDEYGDIVIDVT